MVSNGLFARAKARVAGFSEAERAELLDLYKLNQRPESLSFGALGGEPTDYTEVTLHEGDLLVIDPSITHSASPCAVGERHVLFTTVFPTAAIGTTLWGTTRRYATAPPAKFPRLLTEDPSVRLHSRSLFDWSLPSASQTASGARL